MLFEDATDRRRWWWWRWRERCVAMVEIVILEDRGGRQEHEPRVSSACRRAARRAEACAAAGATAARRRRQRPAAGGCSHNSPSPSHLIAGCIWRRGTAGASPPNLHVCFHKPVSPCARPPACVLNKAILSNEWVGGAFTLGVGASTKGRPPLAHVKLPINQTQKGEQTKRCRRRAAIQTELLEGVFSGKSGTGGGGGPGHGPPLRGPDAGAGSARRPRGALHKRGTGGVAAKLLPTLLLQCARLCSGGLLPRGGGPRWGRGFGVEGESERKGREKAKGRSAVFGVSVCAIQVVRVCCEFVCQGAIEGGRRERESARAGLPAHC